MKLNPPSLIDFAVLLIELAVEKKLSLMVELLLMDLNWFKLADKNALILPCLILISEPKFTLARESIPVLNPPL